jgi:hypothetical protein
MKGYNPEERSTELQHISNKLQTKTMLTTKEINIVMDNSSLFKEYLSGSDSSGIRDLLAKSTDTDKIAEMINNAFGYDKVKELLSGLNSGGIGYLLVYSTDEVKIAEMIINAKGDTLDSYNIYTLLVNSTDKDKIAEMINNAFGYDKVKEYLSGLNSDNIRYLLEYSTDKDGLKRLLDKYGIDYSKNESVKSLLRNKMIYL